MVTIRLANIGDVEAIHDVHVSSIKELCSSHYSSDDIKRWTERQSTERYLRYIEGGGMVVAEEFDKVIAFGHLGEPEENITDCNHEIKALYVAPGRAKKGVGTLLLKRLEREAINSGRCKNLLVYSSKNAIEFYKKFGFVKKESVLKCGGECNSLTCVKMIKSYTN